MRAVEFIDEAFDRPYPFSWEKSANGDVDAIAKLDDGDHLTVMFSKGFDSNYEAAWNVDFYRNNSQEVTMEGDAYRVFATVLAAMQVFIKKYRPQIIIFAASKETDPSIYYEPDEPVPNPESRAKLYDRMVQRYATALGFAMVRIDQGSKVIYQLNRMKKPGVAEGSRVARKAGQPAGSKKHSDLYTDENPKGTITGLKFATAEDARTSVSKIRASGRSHAHKIQAAVAMEQRARAAGKAEAASVYRRYINANKKTESLEDQVEIIKEDLRKWFKQKWVRFGPDGKIRGDCARGSAKEGKPKCLPRAKAHALGKKGRATAGARKRRQDPDANRSGKAINVKTK